VFLTPAGRALRSPVEQAWMAADERLTGAASLEQLATLQTIIGRLTLPSD
jgi:hypothetical protein